MSIKLGFLETRVARRLFLRFVLCAVLPIGVLAAMSYATVTANLRERSDLRLHEVATATERSVRDRLDQARDDLALLVGVVEADPRTQSALGLRRRASNLPEVPAHVEVAQVRAALEALPRSRGFSSLAVVGPAGAIETVFGNSVRLPALHEAQVEHLEAGNALLIETDHAAGRRVWLGLTATIDQRPLGVIWAELDRDYLWEASAQLAALPDVGGMCVLNATFAALHGPAIAERAFREAVETAVARAEPGNFAWTSEVDGAFRSVSRPIFLGADYRSPDWHVVVNIPESAVLAPLQGFTYTFLPLVLIVFVVVLVFSLIQIRRTIRPLVRLKAATEQFGAEGSFEARFEVGSRDEFQDLAGSFNTMSARLAHQFETLSAMRQLDRVGLAAKSRAEIVDALLQTLLCVQDSEAVSVCTFGAMPGEETKSHAVVRIGPEVNIVHRFDCAPWELDEFRDQEHVLIDVETTDALPCFLRVPPFNDLAHKRFLVVPVNARDLAQGLICFASTNAAAFTADDVVRARQLTDQAALAFSNVNRMEELSHLSLGALRALARTIDASSPWTAGHSERVTRISVALGRRLGLGPQELDTLRRAGLLHDIGKIGVPVEVLNKPGALTDEEFERVKEHVTVGARILEPIGAYAHLLPIVRYHHERMDGRGYPEGLVGEDIPWLARILAVADTFDALTSDRPYRKGLPFRTAVEVVRNASETQLDPRVVEAFLELVEEDSVELDFSTDIDSTIDFVWDDKEDEVVVPVDEGMPEDAVLDPVAEEVLDELVQEPQDGVPARGPKVALTL